MYDVTAGPLFTIWEVGEQGMLSQPDEKFWDHIYKIHFREVLDNLATETKNMLAGFSGKKPRK